MSDTPKIDPVLMPDEWSRVQRVTDSVRLELETPHSGKPTIIVPLSRAAKVIAVANSALPDDDPRKITRARLGGLIDAIGAAIDDRGGDWSAELAFVEALESYLPPDGTPPLRVERGDTRTFEQKLNDAL